MSSYILFIRRMISNTALIAPSSEMWLSSSFCIAGSSRCLSSFLYVSITDENFCIQQYDVWRS